MDILCLRKLAHSSAHSGKRPADSELVAAPHPTRETQTFGKSFQLWSMLRRERVPEEAQS